MLLLLICLFLLFFVVVVVFDNFANVLKNTSWTHKIYNLDKTGLTTVQRPDHIVARKGHI